MDAIDLPTSQQHNTNANTEQVAAPSSPPARSNTERRTSYYNSFQTRCSPATDDAPSYAVAARPARFPSSPRHLDNGDEVLPKYTCSVLREGVMYMRIEKISPFQFLPKQQWRLVYVMVQGTQLRIHKIKTTRLGSDSVSEAGKLIRRYTLQHAEVGLAADVNDSILVPRTRLAHLIPVIARRKAFEKDPDLFRSDKQHAMRLRLESDQLLLAHSGEDILFKWVNSICAGIDIAFPIDERSLPRNMTLPRRRRRQQRTEAVDNLEDRRLIQEQERILRTMYPALGRSEEENANTLRRTDTTDFAQGLPDLTQTATIEQDGEDIDLAALSEEITLLQASISRPSASRQTTADSAISSSPSTTAPHQQFRYIRRCMPVLLFDAGRASSIIMCHGRRLRINHRMDMLEEWELKPPTYDSHKFSTSLTTTPQRTSTYLSTTDTASIAQSGSDDLDIRPVRTSEIVDFGNGAGLEKTQTARTSGEGARKTHTNPAQETTRTQEHRSNGKMEEHTPLDQRFPILIGF
ncbi:hypothetical protein BDV97DRAFT_290477 [Delphinella strobiligena]|nr:hypothetical protein BDV97DRAFT_290477 [Delphinella strobiligena]